MGSWLLILWNRACPDRGCQHGKHLDATRDQRPRSRYVLVRFLHIHKLVHFFMRCARSGSWSPVRPIARTSLGKRRAIRVAGFALLPAPPPPVRACNPPRPPPLINGPKQISRSLFFPPAPPAACGGPFTNHPCWYNTAPRAQQVLLGLVFHSRRLSLVALHSAAQFILFCLRHIARFCSCTCLQSLHYLCASD